WEWPFATVDRPTARSQGVQFQATRYACGFHEPKQSAENQTTSVENARFPADNRTGPARWLPHSAERHRPPSRFLRTASPGPGRYSTVCPARKKPPPRVPNPWLLAAKPAGVRSIHLVLARPEIFDSAASVGAVRP